MTRFRSPFQPPAPPRDDDSIPVLTERLDPSDRDFPPLDFDTTIPTITGMPEGDPLEESIEEVIEPDVAPLPVPPAAKAATPLPQPVAPPSVAAPAVAAPAVIAPSPAPTPEELALEISARVRARLEPEMTRFVSAFSALARKVLEEELRGVLGVDPASGEPRSGDRK